MHPHLRRTGFTILELLVVIAIVGILATLVTVSLQRSLVRSRDTAAKRTVNEAQKAISDFVLESQSVAAGVIPHATYIDTYELAGTGSYADAKGSGNLPLIFTGKLNVDYQDCGKPVRSSYPLKVTKSPGVGYSFVYMTEHGECPTGFSTTVFSGSYTFYATGLHDSDGNPSAAVYYSRNGQTGTCTNSATGGDCPKYPSFSLGSYLP